MGDKTITDHSPCQYPQHRDCTLLLSFDEWSEVEGYEWIRKATDEELETMRLERARGENEKEDAGDWHALFRDTTGRPYLAVTVLASAPGHIWRQASGHLRILRFREDA